MLEGRSGSAGTVCSVSVLQMWPPVSPGECYLTDWTVWSGCQFSCVNGEDLGFGSVQVRSRAVVAQDPENLLQCPEQELEARPCTGQSRSEVRGDWAGSASSCAVPPPCRGQMFGIPVENGALERFFPAGVV